MKPWWWELQVEAETSDSTRWGSSSLSKYPAGGRCFLVFLLEAGWGQEGLGGFWEQGRKPGSRSGTGALSWASESLAYRQKIEKITGIKPNVSTAGRSFFFTRRNEAFVDSCILKWESRTVVLVGLCPHPHKYKAAEFSWSHQIAQTWYRYSELCRGTWPT